MGFTRREIAEEDDDDDLAEAEFVVPQHGPGLAEAGREEWLRLWAFLISEGKARRGLAPLVKALCRLYDRAAVLQNELDDIEQMGGSVVTFSAHGPKIHPLEDQLRKTLADIIAGLRHLGLTNAAPKASEAPTARVQHGPPLRDRRESSFPSPKEED